MLVAGVAAGAGRAIAIGDPNQVLHITVAALARIPAAWVMVSLVVAVWGLWPHVTGVVWGAYAAFIVVGEFGQLWGVPQWVMDFSPFTHSPMLPGAGAQLWGMLWLTVVAGAFLAGGSAAFRHRDLAG